MTRISEPLFFTPEVKPKLWGEERWLLSAYPSCPSVISSGPFKDRSLDSILPGFPLLIKEITAQSWLSIQVHPSEELCESIGGEPKNEMWRILSPGPIIAGLKRGVTKSDLAASLSDGTIESLLVRSETCEGDIFEISAGLVHSLGAGVKVFEIQQTSDTTLRLYDWGRVDKFGRERELHIEEALRAVDERFGAAESISASEVRNFRFSDVLLDGRSSFDTQGDFVAVYCASGNMSIGGEMLKVGTLALLPPGVVLDIDAKAARVFSAKVSASW